jgi:histidinol-phosphate phosphatase family protein
LRSPRIRRRKSWRKDYISYYEVTNIYESSLVIRTFRTNSYLRSDNGMKHSDYINKYFADTKDTIAGFDHEKIDQAIEALFHAWRRDLWVYTMGNGGSASTANHFSCDLGKTINDKMNARAIKSMCLGDNFPIVTATINDRGWDTLYDQLLHTYYTPGGLGVAFSVHGGSGKDKGGAWSQNLLRGLQFIKDRGGVTIGFSGFDGGAMKDLCDISVVVPAFTTPLVESLHVKLNHLIAFRLKEKIENYAPKNRAVFLDRDGVLTHLVDYPGIERVAARSISDFKIAQGAREMVERIKQMGYLAIVVTNQNGLTDGTVPKKDLEMMHERLKKELSVDDIFVCPHTKDEHCRCRKPNPGMLLDAADKHDIDLARSFMVGDWWRDIDAGKNAGCKTVLVSMPSNDHILHYDYLARDLGHVSKIVAAHKEDTHKTITHTHERL